MPNNIITTKQSSMKTADRTMNRRVCFDTTRNTFKIVRRLSANRVAECFWTPFEMQQRRRDDRRLVEQREHSSASSSQSNSETCFRGLESRTKLGRSRRRWIYEDSIQTVLEEHWHQKLEGWNYPDAIANSYKKFSMLAMEEARWLASQDAQFALNDARREEEEQTKRMARKRPSCEMRRTLIGNDAKVFPLPSPSPRTSIAHKKQRTKLKSFVRHVLWKRGV